MQALPNGLLFSLKINSADSIENYRIDQFEMGKATFEYYFFKLDESLLFSLRKTTSSSDV